MGPHLHRASRCCASLARQPPCFSENPITCSCATVSQVSEACTHARVLNVRVWAPCLHSTLRLLSAESYSSKADGNIPILT